MAGNAFSTPTYGIREHMKRLTITLATIVALMLTPAHAQVMSWWLGGADDNAQATAEPVTWWLGEDGGQAPEMVQPVNWWLGTPDEPEEEQVQANQTLGWWLGASAAASGGEDSTETSEDKPLDFEEWANLKSQAETALGTPNTPDYVLENFRSEIADWRERFLTAQNANRTRIDTIRNQISALGEPPAEGETEAPEIAERRAALNEQLAQLQAPGIAAQDAYLGADGLIREIDSTLRERQANKLLELGPSPLVPINWPTALTALKQIGVQIWDEAVQSRKSAITRQTSRENLPAIILFLILGLGLLLKGRRWSDLLATRFLTGSGRRAKRVLLALIASLGQVILPFIGIILLITSVVYTGLAGKRGIDLLNALPTIGFVILAARWLGHQVFARSEETVLLRGLTIEQRAEGRFYSQILGLLFGIFGLLGAMLPNDGSTKVALVVLSFPLLLLGGLILFRIGQILISASKVEGEIGTRVQILKIIGWASMLIGIGGPILAAIGYYTLARFFIFPAILSLALLAFLIILQRLTADLYALISRRPDEEDREALMPVLVGFVLGLLSLPVFALIWGARVADLTELWAKAREGFVFGETRIAPTDFLTFAVVFAIGYMATRLVQGTLRTSVLPKTKIDLGGQTAIVSGLGYIGVFMAAVIAITTAGIDLSSLAIVAGALSVGIGFGLQNIVSNFISGIILLIERPISEGDWIEVNGQTGYVRNIAVRSTRIETFDRTDVIVPNSDLISGMVTNYTRGNLTGRIIVPVGVAYGTDTRMVEEILREVAEAHPLVSLNPMPAVLFTGFGADSLDFEIRAILRDVNFSLSAKSDMNHEIAARFAEAGIEIPFAQRDIWLRNPEALTGAQKPAPKQSSNTSKSKRKSVPFDPSLGDLGDAEGDK